MVCIVSGIFCWTSFNVVCNTALLCSLWTFLNTVQISVLTK
jgi:hypothetical protein